MQTTLLFQLPYDSYSRLRLPVKDLVGKVVQYGAMGIKSHQYHKSLPRTTTNRAKTGCTLSTAREGTFELVRPAPNTTQET